MRTFWNGSVSFGLVNIPIHVYVAAEDHALSFHMLHKKDLSPVRFARICKADGKEIEYKDIVKGYAYEKDAYVVIEPEDFKKANPKKTSTIEIEHFVDLKEIDPIYYEKPYYLEPDKKALKAYGLLTKALTKAGKAAVVTFVFHEREHLGLIIPSGNLLVLMQMRFHSTIRSSESLELPTELKASAKELDMALKLIDQLSSPFDPKKYKDTYTEELMATIEAKIKGRPKKKTVQKKTSQRSQDLMELLKASVDEQTVPKKKAPFPKPSVRSKGVRKSR